MTSYTCPTHTFRGYRTHTEPETDSDTDGGPACKLPGPSHIELSRKGIPHGILHFPEQLKSAGHVYMHDSCAPEASHRHNIKKAMDRVRKGTESETSASMIDWQFRVRTWKKIIDSVKQHDVTVRRKLRIPSGNDVKVFTNATKGVHNCFPLVEGGDNLITNDVRVSHHELSTLIARSMGWDLVHVQNRLRVQCFTSAMVVHPSGIKRSYWATDTEYPYNNGVRRDMIEVDLGAGAFGVAQIISFIKLTHQADNDNNYSDVTRVLIRWMSKSTTSTETDDHDRPMCPYPLSRNHCLWQWSDAGRDRASLIRRGFMASVTRRNLWCHVPQGDRQASIDTERRARYDVLEYTSIRCHANISVDPSTGHMLQTLQIV